MGMLVKYHNIIQCLTSDYGENMKKIKKITFIVPTLSAGGAERVVAVLSNTLASTGYNVNLILYDRVQNEYPISKNVNVYVLPRNIQNKNKVVYYVKKLLLLRKIIRDINPDILIPFLPYQVEHTYVASRGLHIPMVVTVRNNPLYDTENEKQRKRRDRIAKHVEGVFLQTDTQRAYFSEEIKKKCFVVANPISESIIKTNYTVKNQIKRLISVGRLEEQKNFSMLIEAFYELRKYHTDLTLDIYGEGSLKEQLQQQINTLGLENFVKLCGRTNDIAGVLAEHDLFIMPSNYEGMPNSLMEAMGVGLPCISTDCPTGPRELLGENERGILIEIGNKDDLVKAIHCSLMNVDEMKIKATFAKKYIREYFSPDKIAETLIDALEKLIN